MAEDERLLDILRATPQGQPVPNLLLAAIHFLLLGGVRHELARFYPSCDDEEPLPCDGAFAAFREFCLEHERTVRQLLTTRRVQTNEVGRCAYLLPALSLISRQNSETPLALIEVGTSAGLLLNFDRYAYDYGNGRQYGGPHARVLIQSEWKGSQSPSLCGSIPTVVHRVGIDLHPINLDDPQEALWLRSLVWPDQPNRLKLISDAIVQFQTTPAPLMEGNAIDLLPSAVESASAEATACVFHCHTLNQFSEQQRQDFALLLANVSTRRPLVQLSAEWIGTPVPQLRMIRWSNGHPIASHLANVDHHGSWIEWLAPA
jgi:hypothetical protein